MMSGQPQYESDEDQQFCFEKELEFVKNDFDESSPPFTHEKLEVVQPGSKALLQLRTLENQTLKLEWSVLGALQLKEVLDENDEQISMEGKPKVFEDINQMMMVYSDKYKQLFNEKLQAKLFALVGADPSKEE